VYGARQGKACPTKQRGAESGKFKRMKKHIQLFVVLGGFWAVQAMAQMTPVGVWHTIDDKTGETKGEVQIVEKDGVLTGKVVRSLRENPKDLRRLQRRSQRPTHPRHGDHSRRQERRP
jgi:hypothetical protein